MELQNQLIMSLVISEMVYIYNWMVERPQLRYEKVKDDFPHSL